MADRPQVLVWSWSLQDDSLTGERAAALLSDDEKARHRGFVTSDLGRRFLAARAGLRQVLARHAGLDPRTLAFVANEFGKPRLAGDRAVHFNLSHSEERAVLAVCDTAEVGIDLEYGRPVEHADLARRYFHPDETAAILRPRDIEEQRRAFFRTWTLKEAVVKALGCGLSIELDSFAVAIDGPTPRLLLAPPSGSSTWWLQAAATDGFYRALAVPGVDEVELIQRTV